MDSDVRRTGRLVKLGGCLSIDRYWLFEKEGSSSEDP